MKEKEKWQIYKKSVWFANYDILRVLSLILDELTENRKKLFEKKKKL